MTHENTPQAPETKTPETPTDPYAGLSNTDLTYLLLEKSRQERRAEMIRELKGEPPPPKPDPAAQVTARASRLRNRTAKSPDQLNGLTHDIAELRSLFSDLLLHNANGDDFSEKYGLMVALRAQKQALATLLVLDKLQHPDNKRNRGPLYKKINEQTEQT